MKVYVLMGYNYEDTLQYGVYTTPERAQAVIDELTIPVEKTFLGKTKVFPKNEASFQIEEVEMDL